MSDLKKTPPPAYHIIAVHCRSTEVICVIVGRRRGEKTRGQRCVAGTKWRAAMGNAESQGEDAVDGETLPLPGRFLGDADLQKATPFDARGNTNARISSRPLTPQHGERDIEEHHSQLVEYFEPQGRQSSNGSIGAASSSAGSPVADDSPVDSAVGRRQSNGAEHEHTPGTPDAMDDESYLRLFKSVLRTRGFNIHRPVKGGFRAASPQWTLLQANSLLSELSWGAKPEDTCPLRDLSFVRYRASDHELVLVNRVGQKLQLQCRSKQEARAIHKVRTQFSPTDPHNSSSNAAILRLPRQTSLVTRTFRSNNVFREAATTVTRKFSSDECHHSHSPFLRHNTGTFADHPRAARQRGRRASKPRHDNSATG